MAAQDPAGRGASASRPELEHRPGLDGIRAIAVLAVMLFHGGVSWARGGFLGVEVFFVLSGYLITSLLLVERERSGRIALRSFWGRRARRLLPALFLVVIACAVYEAIAGPSRAVPDFSADGLATLFYVANWHQIWTGAGYFTQVGLISPLQHTWSLAIEEQFYVLWPLLVAGLLGLGARRRRGGREHGWGAASQPSRLVPLLVLVCIGALASAAEMAWLYHGGSGVNRVYYGTDTRASGLLVGAALAIATRILSRKAGAAGAGGAAGAAPALAGLAGGAALGVILATTNSSSAWLYRGGFLAVDLATAAVIAAAVSASRRPSPVRTLLSLRPLTAIGAISYGLYLWHFPLFGWLTESSVGVSGTSLLLVRIAATFVVATASFVVVEQPVRRRRLPAAMIRVLTPTAIAVSLAAVLVAGEVTTAAAVTPVHLGRVATNWRGNAEPGCKVAGALFHLAITFHTCPPAHVMIVGDSIATTLGVELAIGEQRYGTVVDDAAILGCSYSVKGDSDEEGTVYGGPNKQCLTEYPQWTAEARRFKPQVVLVEMGYWDEMNWRWGASDYLHIGNAAFDAELRSRMEQFVRELSAGGRQVVFLTVPWVNPLPWPNGQVEPQATAVRHVLINQMIERVAKEFPKVAHVFDISPYVTPAGKYQADVGGSICRMSDGIHLFMGSNPYVPSQTYCGAHLQAALLSYVRELIAAHHLLKPASKPSGST